MRIPSPPVSHFPHSFTLKPHWPEALNQLPLVQHTNSKHTGFLAARDDLKHAGSCTKLGGESRGLTYSPVFEMMNRVRDYLVDEGGPPLRLFNRPSFER